MKLAGNRFQLSATDLSSHLACRHLTVLDRRRARGEIAPPSWFDPGWEALRDRGLAHERAYTEHLSGQGLEVHSLHAGNDVERTRAAMREGVAVLSQAPLASADGRWIGRADVLLRVETPSDRGGWSYEVHDTKLARETGAGTLLQLCLYSELVSEIQGTWPEQMHVVSPGRGFEPESFRVADFAAYYRSVKQRLERFGDEGLTYPEPVSHCDICLWWPRCDRQWRADDHLSLAAGISKFQRRELAEWDVGTLEALARVPIPIERRPRRGSREGYERACEQARIQLAGRERKEPVYELLPVEAARGLARLPEPSEGDLFFDIEGDPFVEEGGLEYLLGLVELKSRKLSYRPLWAPNRESERAAFEAFIDVVMKRWDRFPGFHIYHFGHYEPSALKRLMGRYATREQEIDRMLRAGLFVDLHRVTKEAVRASVESYSLKELERFFGFGRQVPLRETPKHLRQVELALETNELEAVPEASRKAVLSYNQDDCLATWRLRDWLERLRDEHGIEIPRREPSAGDPGEKIEERDERVAEVQERLTRNVPADASERTPEQQARYLLAHLLGWHRREFNAAWWEYFRLRDLPEDELFYERAALFGLEFFDRVGGTEACPVDRYRFPAQDTDLREGDELRSSDGEPLGSVDGIDPVARALDIKKREDRRDDRPGAVFAHRHVPADTQAEALLRIGERFEEYELAGNLLRKRAPRQVAKQDEAPGDAALRLVLSLDGDVLPIQGPPGSGKTYTGARKIAALVANGKKVGVTAVAHKAIRNLLMDVRAADASAHPVHKVSGRKDKDSPVREETNNQKVLRLLRDDEVDVVGGTAWLWAREEFRDGVDVLFVDEAGQMSLADVVAVSQAARSLVLLGDPQQLDQPTQATHPEGTDVSALRHLLGQHDTIPPDRGLFLETTWRLHPSIGSFTSELFYEGRLGSRPELERQALVGPTPFAGAGLWFDPVEHEGNQSSSQEEVERVQALVAQLVRDGVRYRDREGNERPLELKDILIVTPYNAQVSDLAEAIPGARVGTVDRFQGQQAPVVIYSLATSSPEEAPRGMDFLYSLNRLNVATSRAQAVSILVGSPRLLEPECRTPRQMQLANALCRYVGEHLSLSLSPNYGYASWNVGDPSALRAKPVALTTNERGEFEVILAQAAYCVFVSRFPPFELPSGPPPLTFTMVFSSEPEKRYVVQARRRRYAVEDDGGTSSRALHVLKVREEILQTKDQRVATGIVEVVRAYQAGSRARKSFLVPRAEAPPNGLVATAEVSVRQQKRLAHGGAAFR